MSNVVYLGLAPGLYNFWPELGEKKPDALLEATLSYYGKHWYVDSPFELKGRGIKEVPDMHNNKPGFKCYKVTQKAFEKLEQQYAIYQVCWLD